jgi:phosphoribosyl-ATP pyrophosphohydrolase
VSSTENCLSTDVLARLAQVIESRKGGNPETSYVARLLAKGPDSFLKKIGEEATELVMAGKDADRQKIIAESADLWFHCMVMLAHFGLQPADVVNELARREGLSGLDEKAARKDDLRQADLRQDELRQDELRQDELRQDELRQDTESKSSS